MTLLPRLLLLSSESPHTGAAGAIILHRLLKDYPADRLLVVTNHPPPAGTDRLPCRHVFLPLAADRLNRTRFWPQRAILRALGATSLLSLGAVDTACAGFAPDIVVTLMQDSWYYDLAARYAAARRLPLALIVHDLAHGFEPVPAWLQARQLARDRAVYRQAAVRLCVSLPMANYFEAKFGVPGEVLLPPRSEEEFGQPVESCRDLKSPGRLVLGYAGGLHYGYGEQLLAMLPALRACGTTVELFGPRPAGAISALNNATDVLRFNGHRPTPEAAWRELVARCDAVLQPYLNPAGPHEQQYRTHFPSKLGDCLSLGLPLLITGPDYASGVAWCREHGECALAVTSPAASDLQQALQRLRDEPALRVALARGGQVAARELSAPALRQRLHAILAGLVPS
jgi:glycosyltransferase involved in cell wall biosynthesis